jgi:hypothetical protein
VCNLNGKNLKSDTFLDAVLAEIGDGHNGGHPIWAILDADAVEREQWDLRSDLTAPPITE